MSTPTPTADRNLIFGLLALQMDFVSREQLLDAMKEWMFAKKQPLGEILCRRGALDEDERADLERLVERHVKRHGGDPQASLNALHLQPVLRRQLDRLDDADVQASLAALAPTPAEGAPNAVCGPTALAPAGLRFRRLREHARGGLGEVFVAIDEELHREVALKEIQGRLADQPESRARFVREAEITGKLEHPGVVPVYGLGAYSDGRPFYAMRFVRGESMQEAIARFHKADKAPRRDPGERSLALRELLGRFVAVCNAVAYAHARGVIHRDLKPANVMLGEYGETLVVDWGLARVLALPEGQTAAERPLLLGSADGSTPTELGQAVGTPAYMPPEQARGEHDRVGVASDVFALGATLYGLLTGEAPYSGPDALEQARKGAVLPARQRNRRVPAALEAVCARAMAGRPEDRYGTAQALAEEVQRWLADEPVSAYPEPLPERLRRWGRRNRSAVRAGLVLLLAGVVGLGVGLWAVGREQARTAKALGEAETNLARAQQAEGEAKANLKQAEANLKLARRAVDECFNVAKEHPLFQGPRMEKAKKLLLRKTLPFYKRFQSQRSGDRRLQHEEADQLFRVGYIEQTLGRHRAALQAYRQARDVIRKVARAHPEVAEYQSSLAHTHNNLGALLDDLGGRGEALQEYQRAGDIFARLGRAHPEVPQYQNGLALTHHNLGNLLAALGMRGEALQEYRRARDVRARLARAHPKVPSYQNGLALTHNNLGNLLAALGRRGEALKECQRARDIQARLAKAHPEVPSYQNGLARTHNNLGNLLDDLGRRGEALKEYQRARDIRTRLVKAHPDVPLYQKDLAGTHNNLGYVLAALGRRGEALEEYGRARGIFARLARAHPEVPYYQNNLASTHNNLGALLAALGRRGEALEEYGRARGIFARLAKVHPEVVQYTEMLVRVCLLHGALLAQMNQLPASLADLEEAIVRTDLLRKLDPRNPNALPFLLLGLPQRAKVLTALGKRREADADWDRVLKLAPAAQRTALRLQRADTRARAGDHQRAAYEVDELGRVELDAASLYNLACVQALNAASVSRDTSSLRPVREKRAEASARAALALLKRAAGAGFFREAANIAHLDKDDDLAALRPRADYKAFRAGLKPAK
jgi:serine/threonine-protein kinase